MDDKKAWTIIRGLFRLGHIVTAQKRSYRVRVSTAKMLGRVVAAVEAVGGRVLAERIVLEQRGNRIYRVAELDVFIPDPKNRDKLYQYKALRNRKGHDGEKEEAGGDPPDSEG